MVIQYKINEPVTVQQFIELLVQSTLGNRRPVDDEDCIKGMIDNASLMVTAWDGSKLIGIARSVTDYSYACYLSDLAVHEEYQRQGIGKQLQIITQSQLGNNCKLILLAAPDANSYYGHIGFTNNERCWVLQRKECIK